MGIFDTIKKAFTTPGKGAEAARRQYTTGRSNKGSSSSSRIGKTTKSIERVAKEVKKKFDQQAQYGRDSNIVRNTPTGLDRMTNKPAGVSFSAQSRIQDQVRGFRRQVGLEASGQFGRAGIQGKDVFEDMKPKTLIEYASNAAKSDTGVNPALGKLDGFTLDRKLHDNIIGWGEHVITDEYSMNDWILSARTVEEAKLRDATVKSYFETALQPVDTYDPNTNTYGKAEQFRLDATLPPWIQPNKTNLDWWDYYKTYAHDVVETTAQAYKDAQNEARIQARNPYKSAFKTSAEEGNINSFLDVIIASVGKDYDTWEKNVDTYWQEYIVNPFKVGKPLTAAGNALWNMMETMDVASRSVRAFVAGKPELGTYLGNKGTGQIFDGQEAYWIKLDGQTDETSRLAQTVFLENGGRELLKLYNDARTAGLSGADAEKLKAQIKAAFDARTSSFADKGITWEQVYDAIQSQYYRGEVPYESLKQSIENVKKTYTDADATFYADSGSIAQDIIIETILDPGLVVGGLAKAGSNSAVKSAARNGVEAGFTAIFKDADAAREIFNNKRFRSALSELIRSNEGRNIIFKDAKKFDDDLELFIRRVSDDAPIFKNPVYREAFKDTVTAHLMGKNISINGAIIESTNWARKALDTKTFRAAYHMDKAIDKIDSAIIKSSFFVPWAGVKATKAGFNALINSETVGKVIKRLQLDKFNAARVLLDEQTGQIDVTKVSDLLAKAEANQFKEASVRNALQAVVDEYDDIVRESTGTVSRYLKGEISDADALRLIDNQIATITGGKCKSVEDLKAYIDELASVKYAGDVKAAYDRVESVVNRLKNAIDRRSEKAVEEFLDKVRQTENVDDLRRLFREYSDNEYIMELSDDVIDNAPYKLTSADINHIVYDIKSGIFTEDELTRKAIDKGLKGAKKASAKTVERTINYDQFSALIKKVVGRTVDEILLDIDAGIRVNTVEKKLADFMGSWATSNKSVVYTVPDALKLIDKMKRQVQFRVLMDFELTSEFSAVEAHQLVGKFNELRQGIKKIDVISLKDVSYVTLMHTDRMALAQQYRNDHTVTYMYDAFYNDVIAPVVQAYKGKSTHEIDLMGSALFEKIDVLAKQKYGFDRTNQLFDEARYLAGFSDDQLHSFMNTLVTDLKFRDELGNIDLKPGDLRKIIEATLRAQTGESKLGMKNIDDMLHSFDTFNPSEFLTPYLEELQDAKNLSRYEAIINKDVLDPEAYVEKQMLFTLLSDPSIITEWNTLAKEGRAPIFFHINTTGLNSEINSMSSISMRKWIPIDLAEDEPLTLGKILDYMEQGHTEVFQRRMSDDELGELTDRMMRRFDMKDVTIPQIRARYKAFYGATDDLPYKSERQIIEEACAYINDATIIKDGEFGPRSVAPVLVVHDLDGFNINYFNNKVLSLRDTFSKDSKVVDYADRVAGSAKNNSCNTYHRLAAQMGDFSYTDEQLDQITSLMHDYITDINRYANGYRVDDMRTYGQTLKDLINELRLKSDAEVITDSEVQFLKSFENANGDAKLADYIISVRNITDLTINPRRFAFLNTELDENLTKAALRESGRASVNVDTRIYVGDVLEYFNLDAEGGFSVAVEDLQKMHEMSKYIINARNKQIVAGAEEVLLPYKARLDKLIQSIIEIANSNAWESTQLAYMQSMRIPDNAVDSYLMARKLYNDHLKYWLNTDLITSFKARGQDLDALKLALEKEARKFGDESPIHLLHKEGVFQYACDYYNNYRRRFFDTLTGGGFGSLWLYTDTEDVLPLLEGAHETEIFNWAARSNYEKCVLTYKNGVLKDGLDKAVKYSEARSDIVSSMRQLEHIDSIYNAAGFSGKGDRFKAQVYMKAKQLFDILNQSGFAKRESFQELIAKASELHRMQLQQARMSALMVDGKLNRDKLLSELLYNGFNMTVFNSHAYTDEEISSLRSFVKVLDDDFVSYYEDYTTGNIFIYLNTNVEISEYNGLRYINRSERFEKPVRVAVPFAEFDELKGLLNYEDLEDFRGVYEHLRSCWEDIRLLSMGAINGTTGRTVSRRQAEEFLSTLPSNMNDWLTSEGLLRFEISRDIVYDPGFVRAEESDILLDFLDTLYHQADVAKDDCLIINEVFNETGGVQLRDLAENFTTEELVEYFGNNSDYVVCTIMEGKGTASGFQVRQLNMNNANGVRNALALPNTAIVPYDVYYDIANYMNRTHSDSVYKQMLGKYLLAYKAFALIKPGTWMRNYIDATTKAALDEKDGIFTGFANMLQYESKAIKDLGTYMKILKTDPSLLTKSNWDVIQHSFKTDMTFDDFQLLRGIIDGNNRFTSGDKYFLNQTQELRGGHNIISGENIGLRNLDEASLDEAFSKYLADEIDLPLNKNEFKDIYYGNVKPDDATNEQYEVMFRKLSNNLRNADETSIFDKTINNMFKPFSAIENMVRYAQTMYLSDNGLSGNQILRRIHSTQFYNAPAWGTFNKLETIMPFITFKYNNIMYWIRMMDENPRFFRYFEDIYGNISEDTIESLMAQGQQLDYEDDYALQSGGIPIGSGKVYFNVGNSFLSAINDFYGFPQDINSVSPLLRDTLRASMYALGLNSCRYFSNLDLDVSDDDPMQKMLEAIPGGSLAQAGYKTFKNIVGQCTRDGGPNMDTVASLFNFAGILGKRNIYNKSMGFSFEDWQEELAAQGKWYDCNQGKIVDLSEKNELGANDPHNSFEDVQAYMLAHFGKIWDANQYKFVTLDKYQEGGYNDGFDFDANPEKAWADLVVYMRKHGKIYDYNQRKFVFQKDYISGGLNDPNLDWDTKVMLMEEKFPDMKWDANQNTFVKQQYYIAGGLNEYTDLKGEEFLKHWNEIKSFRLALYGETYKKGEGFIKTSEPLVVRMDRLSDPRLEDKYDRYFSMLAIPKLQEAISKYQVNSEGLLVTKDGKYVLIGDPTYDNKVFDKFKHIYQYSGRRYGSWKNYSYNKTRKASKVYKGRTLAPTYYTGFGWNEEYGYYREAFEYSYQYHSPQPGAKLNRLISPPQHYPYGGGYGKFSFYMR